MKINSLVGGAAVGLIAALAFAGAATAQDGTELPSDRGANEYLSVTITVTDNCTATITYTNAIPDEFSGSWAYWGDYRVGEQAGRSDSDYPPLPRDDNGQLIIDAYTDEHDHGVTPEQQITDGPLAGEEFGLQYNPRLIHRGETVTVPVTVDAPTTLAAWIKRGPGQEWYVGEVKVEVPCEQADDTPPTTPTPTPPADDDDTAGGTGGGDADDSDTLPVTGSPALLLAGGAVLLLTAGGGVYLVARRRRVTFTA